MKLLVIAFSIGFITFTAGTGCKVDKSKVVKPYNHRTEFYELEKDEELTLTYTYSTGANFCPIDESDLEHLSLVKSYTESMDASNEECAGCERIKNFVFRGNKVGVDTIKLVKSHFDQTCEQAVLTNKKKYVIIKVVR